MLEPGDIISVYAMAKDANAETHTDIIFIQADPFERGFTQSQQGGGAGGGGGGGGGDRRNRFRGVKKNHFDDVQTAVRIRNRRRSKPRRFRNCWRNHRPRCGIRR